MRLEVLVETKIIKMNKDTKVHAGKDIVPITKLVGLLLKMHSNIKPDIKEMDSSALDTRIIMDITAELINHNYKFIPTKIALRVVPDDYIIESGMILGVSESGGSIIVLGKSHPLIRGSLQN